MAIHSLRSSWPVVKRERTQDVRSCGQAKDWRPLLALALALTLTLKFDLQVCRVIKITSKSTRQSKAEEGLAQFNSRAGPRAPEGKRFARNGKRSRFQDGKLREMELDTSTSFPLLALGSMPGFTTRQN